MSSFTGGPWAHAAHSAGGSDARVHTPCLRSPSLGILASSHSVAGVLIAPPGDLDLAAV